VTDRLSFETVEPEVAEDYLSEVFLDLSLSRSDSESPFGLVHSRVDAGGFYLDDIKLSSRSSFQFEPDDLYFVSLTTAGTLHLVQDGVDERIGYGGLALIGRPGLESAIEIDEYRESVVTLGVPAIREAAAIEPGSEALPVFESTRPLSDSVARVWARTWKFFSDALAEPAAAGSALFVGGGNRLLADLLLESFPTRTGPGVEPRRGDGKRPAALRRAVAFVDSNAGRDIGIADIAGAARVSRRSVEYAFRRHLDMTPTAYLRRVRLDLAHAELQGATAADRTTVTTVAYNWGFSSPSRFAAYYRTAFGRPPSETLRGAIG
jgi:AraC-like DNA-binding protein